MSEAVDRDCTRLCRSERHAIEITGAITKRAVTDEALASFIRKICWNFNQVFDDEGRSALHMAASQGRVKLLEWLVRNSPKSVVNSRDKESGYTALHRSVFYGQIAATVKLIELGVYTEVIDNDGLKPLELATLDHNYLYRFCDRKINPEETWEPCEVYVWGINANYTLGTGERQRRTPDILQFFNRGNMSVRQVCLGKFHTVFVTSTGKAWACGQIGRAGACEETTIEPKEIQLPAPCFAAAVMLDSTVFWLQNNIFIEYALNKENSITPTKTKKALSSMLTPKHMLKLAEPLGMCTSRVHGVIWASDAVYTWGQNNGQLGHSHQDKYVVAPLKASIMHIKVPALAAVSDAATAIYANSEVILLHKYISRKIISWVPGIKQLCVDSKIDENGTYSRVTILLLTKDGHLELWRDGFARNTLLGFRRNHQLIVNHAAFVNELIYFTTTNGEVFTGVMPRKNSNEEEDYRRKLRHTHFDTQRTFCVVKTTRIANLHRGMSINVDYEGLNFACVQVKPTCGMKFIPQISPSRIYEDLLDFLENASVDDLLHDVTFKIGSRLFPAHMFIIATKSEPLHELYLAKKRRLKDHESHAPVIELFGIHPEVFDRILKYIYGGTCDVLCPGECSLRIKRENTKIEDDCIEGDEVLENSEEVALSSMSKNMRKRARNKQKNLEMMDLYYDPVMLMKRAASDLCIRSLEWKLQGVFYNYQDGQICSKVNEQPLEKDLGFERDYFMELVDTSVCSKEGHEIPVHKCVLAARLQYFNSMFTYAYRESKSQSIINLPISYNILVIIINFIYFDVCPEVQQSESIDFVCSVLIAADQFIVQRLLEMCEVALSDMVTVKNCADILQFAQTYNAVQLKKYCMEFICFNLCQLLENRSLNGLDDSLLKDVTTFYSTLNPEMSYRVITPFSFATSDDVINEAHNSHPVDLNSVDEDLLLPFDFPKIEFEKVKKKKDKKKSETENDKSKASNASSNDSVSNQSIDSEPIVKELSSKKTEKKEEKWIEIPTAQQKLLQARLKAINSARDIQNETQTESYVKLARNSDTSASRSSTSPTESQVVSPKSSQGNITISHIGPKLSQKQRKKLASQSDSQDVNGFSKLSLDSPPTPKNPWKLPEQPLPGCSSDFSPKAKTLQFNEILADQKKQKDDSARIMTKPLHLTQLEDRAIEELERFYNVHEIDEEYITVRRIHVQMLAPQWVHSSPK